MLCRNGLALIPYLEMMLADTDKAEPLLGRRLILVARVAMATLWLLWAAAAWWSAPRPATVEHLHGDLAAGRIVSYSRVESLDQPRVWAAPHQYSSGSQGAVIVWATSSGRTFYATPDFAGSPTAMPDPFGGRVSSEDSETARLADRLAESGISPGATGPVTNVAGIIGLVLVVFALAVLLGGPDPVRGTRWFWFWVGQLPLGVGLLTWLAFERPWIEPQPPREKRHAGWLGFAVLLAIGTVLSVLALLAHGQLNRWLFTA